MSDKKLCLQDVYDGVVRIESHLQTIDERCANEKEAIQELKKCVFGNGLDGLKTIADRNSRWIALMNWIYGAIFTCLILAVVAAWLITKTLR